jgi:hypothetical protein
MKSTPATLLRLWLIATSVALMAVLVWAFFPVLLFVVLLAGALGILSAFMIGLARRLQARRERNEGNGNS